MVAFLQVTGPTENLKVIKMASAAQIDWMNMVNMEKCICTTPATQVTYIICPPYKVSSCLFWNIPGTSINPEHISSKVSPFGPTC